MSLNLEETFREFAGDAASGLGTDAAPNQAARPNAAAPAQPAQGDDEDGEAVVSKNFKIQGDLSCHDVLRIEGYVEGNIECRTLTVCESARIKGNIRAKTVHMSGKVIGTIEAGGLQEHVIDVPDEILTTGPNILEFHYPRAARPAELVKGSKDERDLAMRLYTVGLTPASH